METTILWIGYNHVQGNPDLQESLRMEEISHISLLCFLRRYSHYHGIRIQEDTGIHYCDNKAQ
eukprot:13607736-Ditylum_brightwellii.AAC.1